MSQPQTFVKRKRYYVDRQIQGWLLWRLTCYWALYHVVLWTSMYFLHVGQVLLNQLNDDSGTAVANPAGNFTMSYLPMLIAACTVLPMLLYDCMRESHRFAGPLLRFKMTLEKMRKGERIESVRLRDGDLLRGFQQEFNEFLKHYNANMDELEQLRAEHRRRQAADCLEAASIAMEAATREDAMLVGAH